MCGICGTYCFARGRPDEGVLEAMNASLVHRGPDAAGLHLDGPTGLAARRLAIIDVAHGDQPMTVEEGAVSVVQNGEILNHLELRSELERGGVRFRTACDTEVLPYLYLRDGPEFVAKLRGMFAIALWDRRKQQLLLARDRFGIKPLYYELSDGHLSFASELKALIRQPTFSREIDRDALHSFLAFNSIPAPLSIFAAARKLGAGEVLLCGPDGALKIERYARPAPAAADELREQPEEELAAELEARLRDSVSAHLLADVPVGVLLSGGVDSSLLTALAASVSSKQVSTFSIGFREQTFNELDLAREVAQRYGTDHHELVVSPEIADLLPKLVAGFDEPFADSSSVPTYLVSQLAAQHVKVVLSGEGGDELFGGYETYSADQLALRVGPLAAKLRPLVERLPSSSARVSFDYRAKRFVRAAALPPLERHHGWKEIFSPAERDQLLRPQWRQGSDPVELLRRRFAETPEAPLLARLQDVDLGIYLADDLLVKTDRMSMAHSLEARVPYLDPVVAHLALSLPTRLKVRGLVKKRLLRRTAAPLVPASITRGRKRGFSIPAAAWLRGELEPLARELLGAERTRKQGYFEPAFVTKLLDDHVARRQDYSRQLWGLMCFSLWAETL